VIGQMLGPYRVLEKLGEGGMGEVYKARDTRLDRSVAIKVLPAHVSADPERRARFEREAKAIAGLTHPHICTLYDVGEHDGSTFLVMEHLTGETLAERLQKGPLPLEQALTVATEIADALSAAHRQGVVHRDLKPGNVMLTKAGAKLLDFGLAKLKGHGEQPAAAHLASAPTQSTPLTSEGMIVGTLQYMAPEQLEGKPADARTDLWARHHDGQRRQHVIPRGRPTGAGHLRGRGRSRHGVGTGQYHRLLPWSFFRPPSGSGRRRNAG